MVGNFTWCQLWLQQDSNAGGDAAVFVDCSEIQSLLNNVKGLKLISQFIFGIYCRPWFFFFSFSCWKNLLDFNSILLKLTWKTVTFNNRTNSHETLADFLSELCLYPRLCIQTWALRTRNTSSWETCSPGTWEVIHFRWSVPSWTFVCFFNYIAYGFCLLN